VRTANSSPPSGHQVAVAHQGGDPLGTETELVARGVPQRVVDDLEVVESMNRTAEIRDAPVSAVSSTRSSVAWKSGGWRRP